jgi:adenosylcobinamide-GDP ribazoletransferase
MRRFLRHYLLALQFFTRVPVTGRLAAWVGYNPQMLRASAAHFPGVGWLVGLLVATLSAALWLALPRGAFSPLIVAGIGTAFGILLTGAFHEDGLADVADGLGGSYQRERALDIMKDSRVGAFGAIAICMALLVKVALVAQLASMGLDVLCAALFLAHVVSRTWPLLLIWLLPHVGDTAASKSKPLADQITLGALLVAGLWCLGALVLVNSLPFGWLGWLGFTGSNGLNGLLTESRLAALLVPELLAQRWLAAQLGALVASALAFAWMGRWFAKRLQGFTGDCLGATQQICELAFYLGFLLGWGALT